MADTQRQVSRSAAIFAAGTTASRILGLFRDILCGRFITSGSLDAFLVAFRLPNMLRDLIGEGASNAAFVPIFSESREKDSDQNYRDLVSAVMSAMLIVLVLLTLAGVLLTPLLLKGLNILAPITGSDELDPKQLELMASLARWTFPYLFFIGMTVFAMAPLFVAQRYAVPSWSPALLNIGIIAACLYLRHAFPDEGYALVFGVWLGGIAQFAVQYIALGRTTGIWRPNFRLTHPAIRSVFVLLLPVLFGQAAGEVNKLVDVLFAASMEVGTVKALSYANRLVQLPLSVFGIAVSVAILPLISRSAARGDMQETRATLMKGLRQTFFLIFPAMLGLIVLRKPIVIALFQGGQFSAQDAERTTAALAIYGAGLLSFAWVKVAVSGFYARQNTRTPVIIASMSMVLNILLNFLLVGPLGLRGLALATSISFTVNFLLLYLRLCEYYGRLWDEAFLNALLRMTLAAIVMSALAYGVYFRTAAYFSHDTIASRAASVALPILVAVSSYVGLSHAFHVTELSEFLSILRKRP